MAIHIDELQSALQEHMVPGGVMCWEVSLAPGKILSFVARQNHLTLICLRGPLWLTQESIPGDILLQDNQIYPIVRKGKVVVQTLSRGSAGFLRITVKNR